MNRSGKAVRYWALKENIAIENILVVTDDLHLPLAKLRLKGKGSDGGHNGLKDIESLDKAEVALNILELDLEDTYLILEKNMTNVFKKLELTNAQFNPSNVTKYSTRASCSNTGTQTELNEEEKLKEARWSQVKREITESIPAFAYV